MLDVARVFGMNVRQHRKDVKMGQKVLAQALGLSVQMISAIENGSMPSMDVALRLASYFQVPLSRLIGDLMTFEEEVEPMPTDAIQIRVLQLCRDLALAPIETRNLMADWIIELGTKLHMPAASPPAALDGSEPPPPAPVREPQDRPLRPTMGADN